MTVARRHHLLVWTIYVAGVCQCAYRGEEGVTLPSDDEPGTLPDLHVFDRPVLLVGGGALEAQILTRGIAALGGAPPIIAADGAADRLRELGRMPSLIIGDLDSLKDPAAWPPRGVPVVHIREQDSTDFEKCLMATAAPLYLGVGFTGGRLDHGLAVLNTMATRPSKRVVLLSAHETVMHLPAGHPVSLAVGAGAPVSLFPLRTVEPGPCHGLTWPLDGLTLAPGAMEGGVIGTSNRAEVETVSLTMAQDGVLLLAPPESLDAVLAAAWPASGAPPDATEKASR
ncbi:MAG: thiamine diphosphokinase [Pseudomonadota bacterium]